MGNICTCSDERSRKTKNDSWYLNTNLTITKNKDRLVSPHAIVSMLKSIVPKDANADEVIDCINREVVFTDANQAIWKVWYKFNVEIGSSSDFAITNLLLATYHKRKKK